MSIIIPVPVMGDQAALGFMQRQTSHIESQVYQMQYPEIQYQSLIPVSHEAHPFAKSVTYYSSDKFGKAGWINGNADDIPIAGSNRAKHEVQVHTGGIGYAFGWEEVGQAQMLNVSLVTEDAAAARRASEEFIDNVALYGDAEKGFAGGLINSSAVTAVAAVYGNWVSASPDNILADLNQGLMLVDSRTNTVVMADTLLLSPERLQLIGSRRLTDTGETILSFFIKNNVYTLATKRPLDIRAVRGLSNAGVEMSPPGQRMVAYRKAPDVLKLHVPMPHRFLPVYQDGPLRWVVPGVMRLGGLDIRQPNAVAYIDGI